MNLTEATMKALQGKLEEVKSTGKLFTCIEDRQGGDFAVGKTMTAEEWGEEAYSWAYGDDWTDPEEPLLKNFNTEQECINFIQDMWELTIVPSDSPEAKGFLGEARSHKEDNEKVAPRTSIEKEYMRNNANFGIYNDKDAEKFNQDNYKEPINAKRNKIRDYKDTETITHTSYEKSPNKQTQLYKDLKDLDYIKSNKKVNEGIFNKKQKDKKQSTILDDHPELVDLFKTKDMSRLGRAGWEPSKQEKTERHKIEAKLVEDEYTDNLKSAIGDVNTLDDVKEWVDDIERRVEELETAYNTMYADILDAADDLFSNNTPRSCLIGLSNAIRDIKEELEDIKFD